MDRPLIYLYFFLIDQAGNWAYLSQKGLILFSEINPVKNKY